MVGNMADSYASLLLNRALRSAMKPVGLCPRCELDSVPGVLWADLKTIFKFKQHKCSNIERVRMWCEN